MSARDDFDVMLDDFWRLLVLERDISKRCKSDDKQDRKDELAMYRSLSMKLFGEIRLDRSVEVDKMIDVGLI